MPRSSRPTIPGSIWLVGALAGAAVLGRLLPHAPNLALLGTLAFISGRYLTSRQSLLLTLGASVISDTLVGWYHWPVMATVWVSYLLVTQIGNWTRHWSLRPLTGRAVGGNTLGIVGGSILFYLLTNGAVWAAASWYPHTWSGLIQCYINALPFFRNTLVSDLSYTTISLIALEGWAAGCRHLAARRSADAAVRASS